MPARSNRANPTHTLDLAAVTILAPHSRGTRLTPPMRLIAVTMLLWNDRWHELSQGRYGMDAAELGDRTSLTPDQVRKALEKMEQVELVYARADGWVLTLDRWLAVRKAWVDKANYR